MGTDFFVFKHQWSSTQKRLIIFLLIGLLYLCAHQTLYIKQPLRFKMLNIGQGDALLIQTPEYKNILIDTGIDGANMVDELSNELYFFRPVIDLFILTHGDLDHYGGIFDVLEKYEVKEVMLNGVHNSGFLYQHFLSQLKEKGIKITYANSDQDVQIGPHLYLDFLFPISGNSLIGQSVKNKNNVSIMARLMQRTKEGWKPLIMLTGDAETEQEQELLLSGQDLKADILKVGHHGSRTSTTDSFLKAVQPNLALVSAGKDNSFGHPHPETIEKLSAANIKIKSTIEEGTIVIDF